MRAGGLLCSPKPDKDETSQESPSEHLLETMQCSKLCNTRNYPISGHPQNSHRHLHCYIITPSALVLSETRATVGFQATAHHCTATACARTRPRGHFNTNTSVLVTCARGPSVGGGAHVLSGQGQLLESPDSFDAQALACHARNIKVVDTSLLGCFCDV